MKTEAIKSKIVSNFFVLQDLSKEVANRPHVYPVWELQYKRGFTTGCIHQFGEVERNSSKINIIDGEVQQVKKSSFSTWKRTLKNINTMLEDTIKNIRNKNVVTKKILNITCFPEELVERFSKMTKR